MGKTELFLKRESKMADFFCILVSILKWVATGIERWETKKKKKCDSRGFYAAMVMVTTPKKLSIFQNTLVPYAAKIKLTDLRIRY